MKKEYLPEKTFSPTGSFKSMREDLAKALELIQEQRELLLEVGARTHKSKKLYDWYCKNCEGNNE